jgi:hypothetical protein
MCLEMFCKDARSRGQRHPTFCANQYGAGSESFAARATPAGESSAADVAFALVAFNSKLRPSRFLLGAMRFYVFLRSILRVLVGMNFVGVRQVCVVGGFLMVAGFVMLGGFMVVLRSMFMMSSCLLVVVGCFL